MEFYYRVSYRYRKDGDLHIDHLLAPDSFTARQRIRAKFTLPILIVSVVRL